MADTSKQCNITNNSGWDVMVALAANRDETPSTNAVTAANGQLEILKTSSGGTVIKNGNADAVTLDRSYTSGSGESGEVTDYDLQICDAAWLYPVANLPVQQQSGNGATDFDPQTVTKEARKPMDSAADFYQTIMAYPDSQLATDYSSALLKAKDAAIAKADDGADGAAAAIAETMGNFFKSTDNYKTVTLADVVAIGNYYNNFPAVWAQYQDSITYYLYGSDETAASFAGTLVLKKSGPMDATKASGGYTCSFMPAVDPADTSKTDVDENGAVALTYANGLFTDNPKAPAPTIGLKGSFMLESLFTANDADKSLLLVVVGTVNGTACIGFDAAQPSPQPAEASAKTTRLSVGDSNAEKFWDTLTHPKTQYDWLVSILMLTGALTLVVGTGIAVYRIYRFVKSKAALKEALSKQIVERTWEQERANQAARMNSDVLQFVQNPAGERLGNFFIEFNPNNVAGYNKVVQNDMLANKLIDAFDTQSVCLGKMLEYAQVLSTAEKATVQRQLDAISDSIDDLVNSMRTELGEVLPGACETFLKVQAQVKILDTTVRSKLNEDAQQVMDENITRGAKLYDEIEAVQTEDAKVEGETDPYLEKTLIPELETL